MSEKGGGERLAASDVAQGLAGLAALLLGSLYGVGALLTIADLRGSNVEIREALTLVPLEDLLARGILTVVYAGFVLLGMAAFAVGMTRLRSIDDGSTEAHLLSLWLWGIIIGGAAAGLVALPLLVGAGIVTGIAFMLARLAATRPTTRIVLALAMAPVLLGLALHAYYAPQPLAKVVLHRHDGSTVEGELVTVDDRWHLYQGATILTVESDEVAWARTAAAEPSQLEQSIGKHLGVPPWMVLALAAVVWVGISLVFLPDLVKGLGKEKPTA